ncbi:potassium channel family protein [Defluviimonas sp. WL0075]|uniref:Potassium channel family protein n=1 Tax=Albidovulum sediminicola TaxID=2984331 RepID=A0ABT2Z061_9RHOB|nr:potassium channel family protein [Defluviimonas sp. WL0075]MCV2864136.1 potassium channel family protein [Defluviimonas sp. WL0075]
MFIQIALGTALMLCSVLVSGLAFWGFEVLLVRHHDWLVKEPHRPKLALVLAVAALWVLGMVTAGVWIWALALWALGIFITIEASVYFSLVAFTTLGFGDILLPHQWRLLGGMAAANGLLNMGLLTAMLVEALRHIRLSQIEVKRRR